MDDMRIQGKTCTLRTTEKLAKPVTNKNKLNQRVCGFPELLTSKTVPIVHKDRNMVQYKMTIKIASIELTFCAALLQFYCSSIPG